MNTPDTVRDLVVLVADLNAQTLLRVLLQKRQPALRIKSITFDVFVHPQRDPGVYRRAGKFFRAYASQFRYALVLFDFAFAGAPPDAQTAERDVQKDLDKNGWAGRSAVVVIEPELKIWVFSDSPHVVEELADGNTRLFREVIAKYEACPPHAKPKQPKEAMEELLRKIRRPRSSAIYGKLAESVSLETCRDPAFARLRHILQQWFA